MKLREWGRRIAIGCAVFALVIALLALSPLALFLFVRQKADAANRPGTTNYRPEDL